MTQRSARRGKAPLLWALVVTAACAALIFARLTTHPVAALLAVGPASAPPTQAIERATPTQARRAALRWRVEGAGLPQSDAFAACLDAQLDAPVQVSQPTPDTLAAAWSPAASPLVVAALGDAQLDVETPIETPSSAPLRAHAAALSCLRADARRLSDLDLDRTFQAAEFRAGSRPGAIDPERFFGVEALNGSLVTRGLSRFTGYELEVLPDAALGWPQARSLALSAVAVVLAEGAGEPGRALTIGAHGRFALTPVEAPSGVNQVVRLAPLERPSVTPPAASAVPARPPAHTRRSAAERAPTAPTTPPSVPDYR